MTAYGIAAPSIGFLHNADTKTSQHFAPAAAGRGNWDSYLRWAPATGILALKAAGVQTTHTLRQQLLLQASAHLVMAGAVWSGKQLFKRERPDGSGNNSFPSGHSAIAFTGATIWRLELKETHPVLSWGGYLLAGITAAQRVRHNEHWVSDVVGGAGVGILSAQASYWLLERYRAARMKKQLPSFY
ncbi:PAP2 superfamily protein [Cnuella takakiae]|uniref:PAP2 superfamily protein n=2 Tax=Cnuella takakiae TaxID=1302690 RepID=A0A1M5FK37_9BACT|nr:PAP2 superfamily protein [Cnuella takakiae]